MKLEHITDALQPKYVTLVSDVSDVRCVTLGKLPVPQPSTYTAIILQE